MDRFYICTKSCTSLPVQYIAGKMYRMDEAGCIYGEDRCGRYPEDTDSEFREATEIEIEIENYFQGHWPGMETAEQCNTSMSFTPLAIMRMVEHFYNLGKFDAKNIQEVQKYWYLLGWGDKEHNEKPMFIPEQDEPTYTPVRMDDETLEHIRQMDYENGKKDMMEKLDKDAIHCKVFLHNGGRLMDFTQEQLGDALDKIDVQPEDKVKVIILKDEDETLQ